MNYDFGCKSRDFQTILFLSRIFGLKLTKSSLTLHFSHDIHSMNFILCSWTFPETAKDLAIITSIMPAVYCFTEIDQIADFKIYDESKSTSEPVIIGKTKKTVIEGVKTDDYLQEYRANVKPGEYILQTAQARNGFISRRLGFLPEH